MSSQAYCARADIENVISAAGVTLRIDDVPPTALGDVIDMAADEIDTFCWARYRPERLAESSIVRHWAAVIACAFLCLRRGNPVPPGVLDHYLRVQKHLDKVLAGTLPIAGVPQRKMSAPTVSIMRATQRPFPRAVVEKSRSTGKPEGIKQPLDPWDSMGANSDGSMDWSI